MIKKYTTAEGNLIVVREYSTYDWVEFSTATDRDAFLAATPQAEKKNIKVSGGIETFPVIIRK